MLVAITSNGWKGQARGSATQRVPAAKGTPRENAQAESFFRTLKHEEVNLSDYEDYDEAEQALAAGG